MLARHRADDGLHCRAFEVHILPVAPRPFEAHHAVGFADDVVWHRLHDDPVDVCNLVVPVVDRIDRTDAGRNVAVHMKTELVRLGDARRQPRRIERAVELDPGKTSGLGFVYECDRLRRARRDVRDLRGIRALPVDERRWVDVRE